MLKQFMFQNGFYYSIMVCLGLGIVYRLTEWQIYRRLIREAENAGKSENQLIKQLKLKVKSCYKVNLKIQNTRPFVESYLYKYRIMGIRLDSMKNLGSGILLLCSMIGILAILTGVYYQMDIRVLIYHSGAAILSILILQFLELQFSCNDKRKEILIILEDYLDNFFINRLEFKAAQKEIEQDKQQINKKNSDADLQPNTSISAVQGQIAAAGQKESGIDSESISQNQVIADVLKEFLA